MQPLRIHFTYRTIEQPHGGANNFLRALRSALACDPAFALVDDFDADFDILFMNQLSAGPANGSAVIPLGRIRERLAGRAIAPKLVVRAVNLRRESHPLTIGGFIPNWLIDRRVVALLNMADAVIFQSDYQREVFETAGVANSNAVRIYNGASEQFDFASPRTLADGEPMEIVSTSIAPRLSKGQDWIARMADVPNVRVRFFGVWPDTIDPGKVSLEGIKTHLEIAAAYRSAHAFLHPALRDPCPNAVVEALHSGLPVIYRAGPGSSAELVRSLGVALDPDDFAGTVRKIRDGYPKLSGQAATARASHSIRRAYGEYKQVIESVAGRSEKATLRQC